MEGEPGLVHGGAGHYHARDAAGCPERVTAAVHITHCPSRAGELIGGVQRGDRSEHIGTAASARDRDPVLRPLIEDKVVPLIPRVVVVADRRLRVGDTLGDKGRVAAERNGHRAGLLREGHREGSRRVRGNQVAREPAVTAERRPCVAAGSKLGHGHIGRFNVVAATAFVFNSSDIVFRALSHGDASGPRSIAVHVRPCGRAFGGGRTTAGGRPLPRVAPASFLRHHDRVGGGGIRADKEGGIIV